MEPAEGEEKRDMDRTTEGEEKEGMGIEISSELQSVIESSGQLFCR